VVANHCCCLMRPQAREDLSLTSGVRIDRIEVPDAALVDTDVQLRCYYSLPKENDRSGKLYAVNWYKGQLEFYSYKPGRVPPVQLHPWAGLEIEADGLTPGSVRIKRITTDAGGVYKCEVLSETYTMDMVEKNMTVVVAPSGGPIVQTYKPLGMISPDYRAGDMLRANCLLLNAKPKAHLAWYINGEKAPSTYTGNAKNEPSIEGFENNELPLQFVILKSHFKDGKMDLDCSAVIGNVYKKTSNMRIYEAPPRSAKNSPQLMPKNSGSSELNHLLILYFVVIKTTFSLQ
ncbi:hypothetical protein QYM36_017937, partial [Artemia franciscana]